MQCRSHTHTLTPLIKFEIWRSFLCIKWLWHDNAAQFCSKDVFYRSRREFQSSGPCLYVFCRKESISRRRKKTNYFFFNRNFFGEEWNFWQSLLLTPILYWVFVQQKGIQCKIHWNLGIQTLLLGREYSATGPLRYLVGEMSLKCHQCSKLLM